MEGMDETEPLSKIELECVNSLLKINGQIVNLKNIDSIYVDKISVSDKEYFQVVIKFPNKLEIRHQFPTVEVCHRLIDRIFLAHQMDVSGQMLNITPLNPGRSKPENWQKPLSDEDLRCKKCPPEDCDGYFCRCESRNIELSRKLRAAGKSPWNKENR